MPEETRAESPVPAPPPGEPSVPPVLLAVFGLPILVVFLWFILPFRRSRRDEGAPPAPPNEPDDTAEDDEPVDDDSPPDPPETAAR